MKTIDDRELAELAREIPYTPPDSNRRDALREAIVLEAQSTESSGPAPRSRKALLAGVAGVLIAAAAAVALVVATGDSPARAPEEDVAEPAVVTPTHRAKVQTSSAADFVHSAAVEAGINDEVVRLRGGRVSVSVEHLSPTQRFRVVAGDGEVEVRGTAFDVVVVDDRLQGVVVHHGLVAVRLNGEAAIEVAGGERWTRDAGVSKVAVLEPQPQPQPQPQPEPQPQRQPVPDPVPAPVPAPDPAPVPAADPAPVPAAAPVPVPDPDSPIEVAFREGRLALRDGDFGSAADLFLRAIASDPDAPLAEDARYWRAVALARAGKDIDAHDTLEAFLLRHPTSMHAGRASLMLGNLLVKSGDTVKARVRYEAALDDSDPDVRAAARKALDALP